MIAAARSRRDRAIRPAPTTVAAEVYQAAHIVAPPVSTGAASARGARPHDLTDAPTAPWSLVAMRFGAAVSNADDADRALLAAARGASLDLVLSSSLPTEIRAALLADLPATDHDVCNDYSV